MFSRFLEQFLWWLISIIFKKLLFLTSTIVLNEEEKSVDFYVYVHLHTFIHICFHVHVIIDLIWSPTASTLIWGSLVLLLLNFAVIIVSLSAYFLSMCAAFFFWLPYFDFGFLIQCIGGGILQLQTRVLSPVQLMHYHVFVRHSCISNTELSLPFLFQVIIRNISWNWWILYFSSIQLLT